MQSICSTFVCASTKVELALEQQCDHDPKTVHHWCIDCCSNEAFEDHTSHDRMG